MSRPLRLHAHRRRARRPPPTTAASADLLAPAHGAGRSGRDRRSPTTRPSRSATPRSRCSATSCAPPSTSRPAPGRRRCTPRAHRARAQPRARGRPRTSRGDSRAAGRGTSRRTRATRCCSRPRCRRSRSPASPRCPRRPGRSWSGRSPAYGDDWWFTGLLAFVRQEQGRFDEAMELSCRSLAEEPGAGHSAHARAHAHYETGDHERRAGLDGRLGHRRRRRRSTASATSPGTPRCTSSRSATSTPSGGGTTRSCGPSTGSAAGRSSTPARCCSAGRSPRTPTTCRTSTWSPRVAGRHTLERPATPFLAMHAAVTLLALGDRRRPRAAGALGRPRTTDPTHARGGRPRWPARWR